MGPSFNFLCDDQNQYLKKMWNLRWENKIEHENGRRLQEGSSRYKPFRVVQQYRNTDALVLWDPTLKNKPKTSQQGGPK